MKGIAQKLNFFLIITTVIFLIVFGGIEYLDGQKQIDVEINRTLNTISKRLSIDLKKPVYENDFDTVRETVLAELPDPHIAAIVVWAPNVSQPVCGLAKSQDKITDISKRPEGDHLISMTQEIQIQATPSDSMEVIGTVDLYLDRTIYEQTLKSILLTELAKITLIVTLVLLTLGIIVNYCVARPLDLINKNMKTIQSLLETSTNEITSIPIESQFNYKLPNTAFSEIKDINHIFETLMQTIQDRQKLYSKSEKRFRSLISNVPGIVYRCGLDKDWTMYYMSDYIETITGYPAGDFINNAVRTYASLIHPDDTENVFTAVNEAVTKKESFIMEYRIKTAASEIRWVLERGQAVFNSNGDVEFLDGVIFDITERKLAEEELQKVKSLLYASLEQSPAGILIADAPDVCIRIANPAALGIRGQTDTFLTDIPVELHPEKWQVFHPDGTVFEPKKLPLSRAILEGVTSKNVEAVIRRSDGQLRWILANASPIRDAKGTVIGGIVVFPDITEIKEAQHEREYLLKVLSAKNEELESIIYASSHDLRSPLINIQGFSGELLKSAQAFENAINELDIDDHQKEQFLDFFEESISSSTHFIIKSSTAMHSLLDGLLKVCRLGRVDVHCENVKMDQLIQNLLLDIQYQIQSLKIEIETEPLPDCVADKALMSQIFSNLLDNAIKYRSEDRTLTIKITGKTKRNHSIYCIEDNGVGIAEQHQKKIFEIFHRLNPKQDVKGEGLGLTIVRRILDRLNGDIYVESQEGYGSKFFVEIPNQS